MGSTNLDPGDGGPEHGRSSWVQGATATDAEWWDELDDLALDPSVNASHLGFLARI